MVLRADGYVAAGRKTRLGGGQRAAQAEWVDGRRACRGPHSRPDAAAGPAAMPLHKTDNRHPGVRLRRIRWMSTYSAAASHCPPVPTHAPW